MTLLTGFCSEYRIEEKSLKANRAVVLKSLYYLCKARTSCHAEEYFIAVRNHSQKNLTQKAEIGVVHAPVVT
ncbi:uncharacterized protein K489DRAFT_160050 [Dissoconium aciculare CBS 342.82]|uniref:Uncharacterized protein n=1 Tax=Dissoconium aciculare CBS 342.82 TaxID=1314786 RepID=A0A6J3MF72_9PEZI|nr:uncharacterized protein K489DRAFT_160050 [Dissoconium aciculare CBS 342.82]KAF1825517.1 hypothetical protein K489DRAFT_160050 [Dissoconium aciculare CBS 342.82]